MDTWTIALLAWVVFVLIPANNQTTLYIKTVGIIISCVTLIATVDWVRVYEVTDELTTLFYEWLLVKVDGDKEKASAYFYMILIILSQPFILGGFFLYKKIRDH